MISAGGGNEAAKVAEVLAHLLHQTYGDGVEIVTRLSTVTISRGKRAAQIQVLDDKRFHLGLRRNATFHMQPKPVDRATMARLVEEMVGAKAAAPVPEIR